MRELEEGLIPIEIKSRIGEIKTLDFNLTELAENLEIGIPEDGYMFHTRTAFSLNKDSKSLRSEIDMSISKAEDEEILASIKTSFIIIIENLDDLLLPNNDEGKDRMPGQVLYSLFLMLANVSLATTRGMFVVKLENTKINNAYFPVYNPAKFVPKEIQAAVQGKIKEG